MASPDIVRIDSTAAGHGWFVDTNPANENATDRAGQIDLLTVVTHEFAHLLGYEHDVLGSTLSVNTRRMPIDVAASRQSDWNGDERFDQLDIVAALQSSSYRLHHDDSNGLEALADSVFAKIGVGEQDLRL